MTENTNEEKSYIVDVDYLRTAIEPDPEFKKELFDIFSENSERNLDKMDRAIKENNNNSWYMAAHAMKGSLASIGAFGLSKILEYAQRHPEETSEQKAELLREVRKAMIQVMAIVKKELIG